MLAYHAYRAGAAFAVCTWVFVLKIQAGKEGRNGRKARHARERLSRSRLLEQGSFKMSALKLMNLSSVRTESRFTYNRKWNLKRNWGCQSVKKSMPFAIMPILQIPDAATGRPTGNGNKLSNSCAWLRLSFFPFPVGNLVAAHGRR